MYFFYIFFFFIHHQPFWPVHLSSSLAGHPSKQTKPNTSTQKHLNQHVIPFSLLQLSVYFTRGVASTAAQTVQVPKAVPKRHCSSCMLVLFQGLCWHLLACFKAMLLLATFFKAMGVGSLLVLPTPSHRTGRPTSLHHVKLFQVDIACLCKGGVAGVLMWLGP